jgi:hypothetical protein
MIKKVLNLFKYYTSQFNIFLNHVQSNLSTTTPLGYPKKWPLYRSLEVFQSKLVLELVWLDLVWPLLTGGRYSEVGISTGLTVFVENFS